MDLLGVLRWQGDLAVLGVKSVYHWSTALNSTWIYASIALSVGFKYISKKVADLYSSPKILQHVYHEP